jgi:hypothetical protein
MTTRVCRRAACERLFRPRRRNQVYCSPRCREAAKNHRWRLVRVNSAERRSLQRLRARHAAKNKRCNTASRMLESESFRQAALWLASRLGEGLHRGTQPWENPAKGSFSSSTMRGRSNEAVRAIGRPLHNRAGTANTVPGGEANAGI